MPHGHILDSAKWCMALVAGVLRLSPRLWHGMLLSAAALEHSPAEWNDSAIYAYGYTNDAIAMTTRLEGC